MIDFESRVKVDIETGSSTPSSVSKEIDPPSDGGMAAWLTVFGAFFALFCSFGQMNAHGTFQSWYTTHQLRELHPSTVSWIGSVQLWVFFFSVRFMSRSFHQNEVAYVFIQGGFIGRIFDVYGPQVIMMLGTIIYVTSMMLTSIAGGYYEYLVYQGILSGLGVGML